ncbi:MAG: YcxB family protein [Anaerolineae bacterium]
MTIEYRVTRREVARAMMQSGRTWRTLLIYAAAIAALFLFSRYTSRGGNLSLTDALTAVGFGLVVIVAAPLFAVALAKTDKRVLTIDANGIETTIGKQHGRKAWRDLASVVPAGDLVVMTGKNGNLFSVPRRAFATEAQRDEFIRLAQGWYADARK